MKIKFKKERWNYLVTKRAKLLYLISCIFQIRILLPSYEEKVQENKYIGIKC